MGSLSANTLRANGVEAASPRSVATQPDAPRDLLPRRIAIATRIQRRQRTESDRRGARSAIDTEALNANADSIGTDTAAATGLAQRVGSTRMNRTFPRTSSARRTGMTVVARRMTVVAEK